ncbi:putative condensin-2 complex subunit D3 [Monocercomonoides exilis]|uniref:putative condensin-2 complex subunit D3 n=1 Tax=Monocercomonoides exilis TaxID=2049356 RepID=UPI0035595A9F|nr:putative condensin-2 complex subunit D3 [Monocercomonoides exilis]|eukprot:MONOS_10612.1-p1 / transcript=MONOS_10612.1 / gene=MONOS_10612 / organism=Monocercomonoides_exilis_PA203 / gene_product=condensin-2 complex subunit D3 / transcript_product=condensin-2 complex subunit D3 / location=Mono_scaffold00489:27949-34684(+) / protein_length=2186 / sequence_SO=supercontig / SO=protein_coding / is_pseudo=false
MSQNIGTFPEPIDLTQERDLPMQTDNQETMMKAMKNLSVLSEQAVGPFNEAIDSLNVASRLISQQYLKKRPELLQFTVNSITNCLCIAPLVGHALSTLKLIILQISGVPPVLSVPIVFRALIPYLLGTYKTILSSNVTSAQKSIHENVLNFVCSLLSENLETDFPLYDGVINQSNENDEDEFFEKKGIGEGTDLREQKSNSLHSLIDHYGLVLTEHLCIGCHDTQKYRQLCCNAVSRILTSHRKQILEEEIDAVAMNDGEHSDEEKRGSSKREKGSKRKRKMSLEDNEANSDDELFLMSSSSSSATSSSSSQLNQISSTSVSDRKNEPFRRVMQFASFLCKLMNNDRPTHRSLSAELADRILPILAQQNIQHMSSSDNEQQSISNTSSSSSSSFSPPSSALKQIFFQIVDELVAHLRDKSGVVRSRSLLTLSSLLETVRFNRVGFEWIPADLFSALFCERFSQHFLSSEETPAFETEWKSLAVSSLASSAALPSTAPSSSLASASFSSSSSLSASISASISSSFPSFSNPIPLRNVIHSRLLDSNETVRRSALLLLKSLHKTSCAGLRGWVGQREAERLQTERECEDKLMENQQQQPQNENEFTSADESGFSSSQSSSAWLSETTLLTSLLSKEDILALSLRCADPSPAVRRQASSTLTQILEASVECVEREGKCKESSAASSIQMEEDKPETGKESNFAPKNEAERRKNLLELKNEVDCLMTLWAETVLPLAEDVDVTVKTITSDLVVRVFIEPLSFSFEVDRLPQNVRCVLTFLRSADSHLLRHVYTHVAAYAQRLPLPRMFAKQLCRMLAASVKSLKNEHLENITAHSFCTDRGVWVLIDVAAHDKQLARAIDASSVFEGWEAIQEGLAKRSRIIREQQAVLLSQRRLDEQTQKVALDAVPSTPMAQTGSDPFASPAPRYSPVAMDAVMPSSASTSSSPSSISLVPATPSLTILPSTLSSTALSARVMLVPATPFSSISQLAAPSTDSLSRTSPFLLTPPTTPHSSAINQANISNHPSITNEPGAAESKTAPETTAFSAPPIVLALPHSSIHRLSLLLSVIKTMSSLSSRFSWQQKEKLASFLQKQLASRLPSPDLITAFLSLLRKILREEEEERENEDEDNEMDVEEEYRDDDEDDEGERRASKETRRIPSKSKASSGSRAKDSEARVAQMQKELLSHCDELLFAVIDRGTRLSHIFAPRSRSSLRHSDNEREAQKKKEKLEIKAKSMFDPPFTPSVVARLLYLAGDLSFCSSTIPPRLITSVQAFLAPSFFTASSIQSTTTPSISSSSSSSSSSLSSLDPSSIQNTTPSLIPSQTHIYTPENIRAQACLALGKMCCTRRSLALSSIGVFVRELHSPLTSLRNNAVIVVGQLMARMSGVGDSAIISLAALAQDMTDASIRLSSLAILSALMKEDIIRMRGPPLLHIIAALADPSPTIREFANQIVVDVLYRKNPSLASYCFIQCLYAFNQVRKPPKGLMGIDIIDPDDEADASSSASSKQTVPFSSSEIDFSRPLPLRMAGPLNAERRYVVYASLLNQMSDKEKFNLIGHIAQNVIDPICETDFAAVNDFSASSVSVSLPPLSAGTYATQFFSIYRPAESNDETAFGYLSTQKRFAFASKPPPATLTSLLNPIAPQEDVEILLQKERVNSFAKKQPDSSVTSLPASQSSLPSQSPFPSPRSSSLMITPLRRTGFPQTPLAYRQDGTSAYSSPFRQQMQNVVRATPRGVQSLMSPTPLHRRVLSADAMQSVELGREGEIQLVRRGTILPSYVSAETGMTPLHQSSSSSSDSSASFAYRVARNASSGIYPDRPVPPIVASVSCFLDCLVILSSAEIRLSNLNTSQSSVLTGGEVENEKQQQQQQQQQKAMKSAASSVISVKEEKDRVASGSASQPHSQFSQTQTDGVLLQGAEVNTWIEEGREKMKKSEKDAIGQLLKKHIAQNVIPVLVSAKNELQKRRSVWVRDVMVCVGQIVEQCGGDLFEMIGADRTLAAEVKYEIERIQKGAEENAELSASSAESERKKYKSSVVAILMADKDLPSARKSSSSASSRSHLSKMSSSPLAASKESNEFHTPEQARRNNADEKNPFFKASTPVRGRGVLTADEVIMLEGTPEPAKKKRKTAKNSNSENKTSVKNIKMKRKRNETKLSSEKNDNSLTSSDDGGDLDIFEAVAKGKHKRRINK